MKGKKLAKRVKPDSKLSPTPKTPKSLMDEVCNQGPVDTFGEIQYRYYNDGPVDTLAEQDVRYRNPGLKETLNEQKAHQKHEGAKKKNEEEERPASPSPRK